MRDISRRHFVRTSAFGLLGVQSPWFLSSIAQAPQLGGDPSLERRREYLRLLQRVLRPTSENPDRPLNAHGDASFEQWIARTEELPPDFFEMPSFPLLRSPLEPLDDDGPAVIQTSGEWARQRESIRAAFERWVFGTMPPPPPNLRSRVVSTVPDGDTTVHNVVLEFGPEHRGTLRLQLIVPPGDGPFPVLLTNHQRRRPWANTATRRGYLTCIHNALDRYYGDVDDSDAWLALYPEHDWSQIARWAWGAMRAVDYLVTHPQVDNERIAIGGHSRNAKHALLAAAFDERIGAAVDSRGNSGASLPWRFTEDMYVQESIEELTGGLPHWFHPRLRFFVGREHKLPVDANHLLAMVAPRGMLISHAYQEHHGNPLGIEQGYRSALEAYQLFGAEGNLGLYQQPGEHPASVEDVERYFDFFDTVFGLDRFPKPEIWVHGYSHGEWLDESQEIIDPLNFPVRELGALPAHIDRSRWPEVRAGIQSRLQWLMGDEPPRLTQPPRDTRSAIASDGWRGEVYTRPAPGYRIRRIRFGDDLLGYVYLPPNPDEPDQEPEPPSNLPVVIWLHPYSYATGFDRYVYWGPLYESGFAVACFDQIGFGTRLDSTKRFYERYPGWSLLGKMVADTRALIDALDDGRGRYDTSRVYLCGYALGAKVALATAALDERVAGVSAAAGFTPLRTATDDRGVEGLQHYSHIHGLLPRLGAFVGHESRVPVDFDEIVAAIAPRPVQLVAPIHDRHASIADVRQAVASAVHVYDVIGASNGLTLEAPEDFNRFPAVWRTQTDWLVRTAGMETASGRGVR